MSTAPFETVDAYLDAQPEHLQADLRRVRRLILEGAPGAAESIRYGMPAYRLPNGRPIYFAGWKQHLSLHDIPVLEGELEEEIARFRSGKDTVKFSYRDEVPFELIERLVAAVARRPS